MTETLPPSEKTARARARRLALCPTSAKKVLARCYAKKASPRAAIQECLGYDRAAIAALAFQTVSTKETMKIIIQYQVDYNAPKGTQFGAATTIERNYFCGWADNFEAAEARLLEKVAKFRSKPPVPEPKEVEI